MKKLNDSSPENSNDEIDPEIKEKIQKGVPSDHDEKLVDQQNNLNESHQAISGEQLDFRYVAYDQDIAILGSKGSGKSYLANKILQSLNGINVWVYDFNFQFHDNKGIVFHNLDEFLDAWAVAKHGHFLLQPFDNSIETFKKFCNALFKNGNCVGIFDELHSFVNKFSQLHEYNQIILSGRPRGVSAISISSRPASIPNNVLTNAKHVFAFRLNLESDIKFLEGYIGSDVWMLAQKDKRKKMLDAPEIAPYTFFYRDMDSNKGVFARV